MKDKNVEQVFANQDTEIKNKEERKWIWWSLNWGEREREFFSFNLFELCRASASTLFLSRVINSHFNYLFLFCSPALASNRKYLFYHRVCESIIASECEPILHECINIVLCWLLSGWWWWRRGCMHFNFVRNNLKLFSSSMFTLHSILDAHCCWVQCCLSQLQFTISKRLFSHCKVNECTIRLAKGIERA